MKVMAVFFATFCATLTIYLALESYFQPILPFGMTLFLFISFWASVFMLCSLFNFKVPQHHESD